MSTFRLDRFRLFPTIFLAVISPLASRLVHTVHVLYLLLLSLPSVSASLTMRSLVIGVITLIARVGESMVTSTGSTVEVGGISYYVPSKPLVTLPGSNALYVTNSGAGLPTHSTWTPVTVVKTAFGATDVQSTLNEFGKNDDVWSTAFLSGKLICR